MRKQYIGSHSVADVLGLSSDFGIGTSVFGMDDGAITMLPAHEKSGIIDGLDIGDLLDFWNHHNTCFEYLWRPKQSEPRWTKALYSIPPTRRGELFLGGPDIEATRDERMFLDWMLDSLWMSPANDRARAVMHLDQIRIDPNDDYGTAPGKGGGLQWDAQRTLRGMAAVAERTLIGAERVNFAHRMVAKSVTIIRVVIPQMNLTPFRRDHAEEALSWAERVREDILALVDAARPVVEPEAPAVWASLSEMRGDIDTLGSERRVLRRLLDLDTESPAALAAARGLVCPLLVLGILRAPTWVLRRYDMAVENGGRVVS